MTGQLTDADKEDLKLARALEPMLRSEGWSVYSKLLEKIRDQHMQSILSATTGIESVLAGEREKGTVVGINLALNLGKTILDTAEQIKKNLGEDPDA